MDRGVGEVNTKAEPWTGGTPMKYTKEQRLDIGRRIYEGEIGRFDAAEEYGIGPDTARAYMRLYRDENHLPAKRAEKITGKIGGILRIPTSLEDYEAMSKEELIQELVRAKIVEARLKKGYEVKGAGAQKEFAPLDSKSTK